MKYSQYSLISATFFLFLLAACVSPSNEVQCHYDEGGGEIPPQAAPCDTLPIKNETDSTPFRIYFLGDDQLDAHTLRPLATADQTIRVLRHDTENRTIELTTVDPPGPTISASLPDHMGSVSRLSVAPSSGHVAVAITAWTDAQIEPGYPKLLVTWHDFLSSQEYSEIQFNEPAKTVNPILPYTIFANNATSWFTMASNMGPPVSLPGNSSPSDSTIHLMPVGEPPEPVAQFDAIQSNQGYLIGDEYSVCGFVRGDRELQGPYYIASDHSRHKIGEGAQNTFCQFFPHQDLPTMLVSGPPLVGRGSPIDPGTIEQLFNQSTLYSIFENGSLDTKTLPWSNYGVGQFAASHLGEPRWVLRIPSSDAEAQGTGNIVIIDPTKENKTAQVWASLEGRTFAPGATYPGGPLVLAVEDLVHDGVEYEGWSVVVFESQAAGGA